MISAIRGFASAAYSSLPDVVSTAAVCYAAYRALDYLTQVQVADRREVPAPIRAVRQPAPASPVANNIRFASLLSFIEEDASRKFSLEKESAQAAGKKPRVKRILPEVPEGEVCALMCSELTPELTVQFHDAYFDVRYFVKGMLTQKDPVSPFTKAPLAPEEIRQLTDAIGIDPSDFKEIWVWPKEYLPYCRELIEIWMEKDPEMIRLQNGMASALRFGRNEEYNQLSQARARLLSATTDEKIRGVEEQFRSTRFLQLLDLAEVQGRISSKTLRAFKEAIPLENPLDAQHS